MVHLLIKFWISSAGKEKNKIVDKLNKEYEEEVSHQPC